MGGERKRACRALEFLSFFMAEMQAGIGRCRACSCSNADGRRPIGAVTTIGGIAGLAMTAPAGAFTDRTIMKRRVVVVTGPAGRPRPF